MRTVEVSRTPAVRVAPPPARVIRLINPMMRIVIRSRLGRRMGPLAVIRFTGRRSGRRRDIPVGLHEIDGVPTVFTDRPWRLNLRGGADVTVVKGGRTWTGRAELVEDPDQVGQALATAVQQVGARNVGLAMTKGAQPTADDFANLGKSMILIHRP
ncbi:MAG: hypothetical protein JWP02_3328 [Acidimicrobiales bacterium]|nr:hypothetical protein [Acidimicrobiales bacterium]